MNQDVNSALNHYTEASLTALRPSINKSREDISWLENIDIQLKYTNDCDLIDHYLQKHKYEQQTTYQ
ncbi:MAG: CCR4-NOT transcriptional regulation complex NOT5 subunit [Oleiphilaceae bacterium]|jgi:CCR4-NOT transcriptional regulation complex NOT5 subunit